MYAHEKIRDYIQSNGLKFNFVASKANIPQKTFYRLMKGEKKLSVEEYEKICVKGLNVKPSFFLEKTSQ